MKDVYLSDKVLTLNDDDIAEITQLLTKRCSYTTKKKVEFSLKYRTSFLRSKWYAERIYKSKGNWLYCAGQDYVAEISRIRKNMISSL